MNELLKIKKQLTKETKMETIPRNLKLFNFEIRSTVKSEKINWQKDFVIEKGKFKFYKFNTAPQDLQKKYLDNYQSSDWLIRRLLSKIKNHWIVVVEPEVDTEVIWDNQASNLAVMFYIKGPKKINIIEKQKQSSIEQHIAVVGNKAEIHYTLLKQQKRDQSVLNYVSSTKKCIWQIGITNQAKVFLNLDSDLKSGNADSQQLIGLRSTAKSNIIIKTKNLHSARQTTSQTTLKGVGENNSKIICEGLIRIETSGVYTNAYLKQNILLLDNKAQAKVIPNLEILNNEVQASHGATVGKIDEQARFYLYSRGLNEKQAKEILISSHLKEFIEKINNSKLQKEFEKILIKKRA